MTNSIEKNVSQADVLATLTFLEALTESRPERAVAISATILASFCKDEPMARDVISEVFSIVNAEV